MMMYTISVITPGPKILRRMDLSYYVSYFPCIPHEIVKFLLNGGLY